MFLKPRPGLLAAITDGGAAWDSYVVGPDQDSGQLTVTRRGGATVAVIRPVFLGTDGATTVRWRAFDTSDQLLASGGTWRDMLTELRAALADGVAQPALPGTHT
jgi:hypothetical protein